MVFDGCAGCYFGNLCTGHRAPCTHYSPLGVRNEDAEDEALIERGRDNFREEWFRYIEENTYDL